MQLFYQPGIPEGIHYLDSEESRHCIKVLRKKINDTIQLVDGKGKFYKALITETDPRQTGFQIIDQTPEPSGSQPLHLAVAPTKRQERMEWMVEKLVELGVGRISFVECDNSERHRLRIDRLQRKAISAMKQSLRATLPEIDDLVPLRDFFSLVNPDSTKLIAHLSENAIPLTNAVKLKTAHCLLIGPEGDFSPAELQRASEAGFEMVSLGNNRLRTETAALVAVAGLNLLGR